MIFLNDISGLKDGVEALGYNKKLNDIKVKTIKGFKGLKITGKDKEYTVEYGEKSDFHRALTLLEGFLNKNCDEINICEERKIDSCGVMIDCSRNSVPKIETLKDIFRRMSKMGLNLVLLYTEDTYEMKKYPYFGYMRGRYTCEELKELDKYALSLGIELVPCIQTLAHLDIALRWHHLADMADDHRTLLADYDGTYEFIEEMLKTARECFTTNRIHIGMDEAHGLGRGRFMDKNGYEPSYEIFLRHLKRVNELTDKYGFSPMMWDDMFFRYSSKKGAYYDLETVLSDDIKKEIPENISQVFWNYYKETNKEYEIYFNHRKELKNEIIFAGGIWTWYTLGICYDKTFRATRPALEECHKLGIKTVFGTMWDGGNSGYLNIYGSLLGMQLYAEYMYHDRVSDEHIKEYFRLCTGYDSDTFMLLDVDNYPLEWCHEYPYETDTQDPNVSKQVLYQDLLTGLFDKNIEPFDLKGFYSEKLKQLETAEIPEDLKYLFDYHKTLLSILSVKCDMGIKINSAYKNKDIEDINMIIGELEAMNEEIELLKDKMYTAWHKEHKMFCWELADLRLSGLYGRVKTVIKILKEFANNKDIIIEELEEEKLLYGPKDVKAGKSLVYEWKYPRISTSALTLR